MGHNSTYGIILFIIAHDSYYCIRDVLFCAIEIPSLSSISAWYNNNSTVCTVVLNCCTYTIKIIILIACVSLWQRTACRSAHEAINAYAFPLGVPGVFYLVIYCCVLSADASGPTAPPLGVTPETWERVARSAWDKRAEDGRMWPSPKHPPRHVAAVTLQVRGFDGVWWPPSCAPVSLWLLTRVSNQHFQY